jgi:hypothetical protein
MQAMMMDTKGFNNFLKQSAFEEDERNKGKQA